MSTILTLKAVSDGYLPTNETAKSFAELLRVEKLTDQDLAKIRAIGYEIEIS